MEEREKKELITLKISNWGSIPYSVTLQCPNGDDGDFADGNKILVGWCDTPNGLMKVYECPVCHLRYRFHGVMEQRWNLSDFLADLYCEIKLSEKLKKNDYEPRNITI